MGRKTKKPPLEERGGYPAGNKSVMQLKPPPKGPAPGAKPKAEDPGDGKNDG